MLLTVITHLLNSLFTAMVLYYIAKPSRKKVTPDFQGHYRLRMGKAYLYLGFICLAIALVFIIATWFYAHDPALLILTPIIVLLFGGGGLLCVLYFKNHYLLYNHSFIEVSDFRGRVKTMRWSDIQVGKFNALTGLVVVKSNSGEKLKVNGRLTGLKAFLYELKERKQIAITI